jgi:26S proteasome regulatory subunit N8
MNTMFKKINGLFPVNEDWQTAREKVIGWYHSGPKLRGSDLSINKLLRNYIPNPILVIVHINSASSDPTLGIPTDAYFAIEEIKDDGTQTSETFVHIPSLIEAEEAEEIGVEHLLRDLKESTGDLATRITSQLESLRGLESRLREVAAYLGKVLNEELPMNHTILEVLQDVFNLLPNLSPTPETGGVGDLERSFRVKTNDQLMCIYLSSMIRAVLALHDLIDSGIDRKEKREEKKEEKKEEKEKEKEKKEGDKNINGVAEERKDSK